MSNRADTKRRKRLFAVFCLSSVFCLLLADCATQSNEGWAPGTTGGVYKVGKPYQVDGQWYYPHANYSYDQTGIASWYGPSFSGQRTADGEIFNPGELTAAHRTLPMPSLARVTNLQNGRSIVVRINDRGPFARGRIIDVSRRAAELLGFKQQGTAEVRVQVLADESKAIADAMRHYGRPMMQTASAEAPPSSAAPRIPVLSESLDMPSNVPTKPQPVHTTPAVHRELLATRPVPEVLHVPVPATTHIFVQAGAFTVLENATKLRQHLAALGRQVTISNAVVGGRQFYRVRVGPLPDVASADHMLSRVAGAGVAHPRIIVD